MNFIFNLLIVLVSLGFAGVYIYSFILNLKRALDVNKVIKNNPKYVEAKVIEVVKQKTRVYVKVEYVSTNNMLKFSDVFELTEKEFNDQYYEGQELKIYYADTKELKKVNCFPTYLEGQKMKIEKGPLFTDVFMVVGGLYMFITCLLTVLLPDAEGFIGFQFNGRPFIESFRSFDTTPEKATACFSGVTIIVFIIFYLMLFAYLKERITGMSSMHKNTYLKICGTKSTAEVKTFKFSKQKNSHGMKEAIMQIEFFTNAGEKIQCELSSYLYSETQEQFVDILYDDKHPTNVVYMRK